MGARREAPSESQGPLVLVYVNQGLFWDERSTGRAKSRRLDPGPVSAVALSNPIKISLSLSL